VSKRGPAGGGSRCGQGEVQVGAAALGPPPPEARCGDGKVVWRTSNQPVRSIKGPATADRYLNLLDHMSRISCRVTIRPAVRSAISTRQLVLVWRHHPDGT